MRPGVPLGVFLGLGTSRTILCGFWCLDGGLTPARVTTAGGLRRLRGFLEAFALLAGRNGFMEVAAEEVDLEFLADGGDESLGEPSVEGALGERGRECPLEDAVGNYGLDEMWFIRRGWFGS